MLLIVKFENKETLNVAFKFKTKTFKLLLFCYSTT